MSTDQATYFQANKARLRRELMEVRSATPADERAALDAARTQLIAQSMQFSSANILATYVSTPDEPHTHELMQKAWYAGMKVLIPRARKKAGVPHMQWCEVASWEDIAPCPFMPHIMEPAAHAKPYDLTPAALEARGDAVCCLVPGLVFDEAGYRLGYGGGFYDRFLADLERSKQITFIGMAREDMLVDSLPELDMIESHDRPVSYLATDRRITCTHSMNS